MHTLTRESSSGHSQIRTPEPCLFSQGGKNRGGLCRCVRYTATLTPQLQTRAKLLLSELQTRDKLLSDPRVQRTQRRATGKLGKGYRALFLHEADCLQTPQMGSRTETFLLKRARCSNGFKGRLLGSPPPPQAPPPSGGRGHACLQGFSRFENLFCLKP